MQNLPTIIVIGYDVDLSWVTLVKQALTEYDQQPPADGPVIRIPGGIPGAEFVVTLKTSSAHPNKKLFTVRPHPHGSDGIILFIPKEPIDQLKQRTGWLRMKILENRAPGSRPR
jgi:hypothetical protein